MTTTATVGLTNRGVLVLLSALLATGCAGSTAPDGPPAVADPVPIPSPPPPPPGPRPDGPAHIYVADADGSAVTLLAPGRRPAWSPDGRLIAFQRDDGVAVIRPDGAGAVALGRGAEPAWSPDGTRIVFTSDEGISVMNADGSDRRTLLRHDFREDTYKPWDMGVAQPAWSPDGALIAFAHYGDGDTQPGQVYVMRSDGSGPIRLTDPANRRRSTERDPAWSPDGGRLAYLSADHFLAVTDRQGGEPHSVFSLWPGDGFGARPAWSPDGGSIAFTIAWFPLLASDVWIVKAAGGGGRVLIADAFDVTWSPDGSRLAFASTRIR